MNTNAAHLATYNSILLGDCIQVLNDLPVDVADFILTDPPYLVNYRDRAGRVIKNDVQSDWLCPAMQAAYRALKSDRVMVCFYGWSRVDEFFAAWKLAGFRPVGHLVFRKEYRSKTRFLHYQHEQAYLLAKGNPSIPREPIADVLDMDYSGNKLHPTQKPVAPLMQLISSFTSPQEIVLDPFAGSGSSCAAALLSGRGYIGVEMDEVHHAAATARLGRVNERLASRGTGAALRRRGDESPLERRKEALWRVEAAYGESSGDPRAGLAVRAAWVRGPARPQSGSISGSNLGPLRISEGSKPLLCAVFCCT